MFISCEDTKKLIAEKNAQFVDVRTPEEYHMSQLPNAINVPLQDIDRLAASQIEKDRPVIVFCRSGQRSHMAMQILMSLGYSEVYNMGPYQTWFQCPDA